MTADPAPASDSARAGVPVDAPGADESMISLRNVHKIYHLRDGSDVRALDGLTLEIPAGSIHGVVGTSGAGKSTLVRCLTALERPTDGEVRVAGQDVTSLSASELRKARRAIGMVFQHANLLEQRTAAQNIAYPLDLAGAQKGQRRGRVSRMLELVGLADRGSSYPAQLSGGQQQRVGIARALADEPAVLLCDEPTSALDPETTRSILDLIRDVRDRLGVTVVIITHERRSPDLRLRQPPGGRSDRPVRPHRGRRLRRRFPTLPRARPATGRARGRAHRRRGSRSQLRLRRPRRRC